MSSCPQCRPDESTGTRNRQMSVVKELFDRWEPVCHEHGCGLRCTCSAPPYIRHDVFADRIATPEEYLQELEKVPAAALNARCVVHERTVMGERAWQRIAIEWVDAASGEKRMHAGLQLLRFEAGQLVEAWLMLSAVRLAKVDAMAQPAFSTEAITEVRGHGRYRLELGSRIRCSSERALQ